MLMSSAAPIDTADRTSALAFGSFLVFLLVIGPIAMDMYVPSLPFITNYFQVSTTAVKLTITFYLFGFSFAQLIYGPLSDRFGRRIIMLIGLVIALAGSLLCILAPNIYLLMAGRFIQGVGVAACASLTRAVAQDVFKGPRLAQVISYLSMCIGVAPAIAPIVGGYFQHYFGWRSVFIFMATYVLLALFLVIKLLPETNVNLNLEAAHLKKTIKNYWMVLTHSHFITNVTCSSMAAAGGIAYYTLSPFLLQRTLGLTPVTYGWLATAVAVAVFLGKGINALLVNRVSLSMNIIIGNLMMLFGGILMLVIGLFGVLNVAVVVVPFVIFAAGTGLVYANAFVGAFSPFKGIAGTVGSLYSCLQISGAFLASVLAAHLPARNQLMLAALLTLLSLISSIVYFFHWQTIKNTCN